MEWSYHIIILKRGLSLTKSALYLSDGEFCCLSLGLPLHNVYILEVGMLLVVKLWYLKFDNGTKMCDNDGLIIIDNVDVTRDYFTIMRDKINITRDSGYVACDNDINLQNY